MANTNGSIGIDLTANQLRVVELDSSKKVLQTHMVDLEDTSVLPEQEIQEILNSSGQAEKQIGLLLPLKSTQTIATWVPKSFEDPELFLQDYLSNFLVDPRDQYQLNIDVNGPKSIEKGKMGVAVATRKSEIESIVSQVSALPLKVDVLDHQDIATINLLEIFNLDLPSSYVVARVESKSLTLYSFEDEVLKYSESQPLEDLGLAESQLVGFVERQFEQASSEIPVFAFGGGLALLSDFGSELNNPVELLSLDKISDSVWDDNTKYACALSYSLALRSLEN